MCGIAGYVGARQLAPDRIDRCLELMRHRGPDHQAAATFRNRDGRVVHLLSARLDIIDLAERSNQPFRVGDKTIAYNGELYNYLEIRDDLRRRGRSFRTASDTEVLLTALDEDGVDVLDRCEGMWAFAMYDDRDGSVLLSRDRFGEKPLCLYRDETGLYFGSEPRFVFELAGRRPAIDLGQVQRYLVNGYRALYKQPGSFYVGLDELPPAGTLHVAADGTETAGCYWQSQFEPDAGMSHEDAVARTREHVLRAVELRLRADVPLAFCMSGGIDSLSLISTAKRVFDYDVHGYTVVNEDERYAEQDIVDPVVAELGIRHTAIPLVEGGFIEDLREMIAHRGTPLYTISFYAHWLLMRAIGGDGYRIAVSGSAGDELFSGYYDHHIAYLHEIRGEPELYSRSLAAWREHVVPEIRNPYLRNERLYEDDPGQRDFLYLNADEFRAYLKTDWNEGFVEKRYTNDVLRNRMLNELHEELIPVVLHEDDLDAMHFSIENRTPFLDRQLVDFSLTIPTRHLIREGRAKAVLRDAMRGIVPDAALDNRRKVGFNAPVHSVLDTTSDTARRELLDDSPIYEIVRRDKIEELLRKTYLPNSENKFLFSFINSKLFLEEFGS